MDIALLVNSAPPHPLGGAERQALDLSARLAARGHRVTLFARRFGSAPLVEARDGFTLVRCPFLDMGPLRAPSQLLWFLHLLRQHARGVEVILSYQTFIPGFLAAQARDHFGVPFVLWLRSQDEIQYAASAKFRGVAGYVLPRAAHVLAQSERMRQEFLAQARGAFGPALAERVAGITTLGLNGVEVTASTPTQGRGLVFVGRLVDLKDLSTLFRALRLLPEPRPPVRIVGDGPMRAAWETEARDLPVTFVGRVPPEAVAAEYRKGRVFVLLSREEGMPNVVLEAMGAGVPVVSTPVAALPDFVHDDVNGYLFPVGNDTALAACLAPLLSNDALHRRLALAAIETARRCDWGVVLPVVEDVLARAARTR